MNDPTSRDTPPAPPRWTHTLRTIVRRPSRWLAVIAGVGTIGLMFLTVADVSTRLITGGSIAGAYEYTEIAVVGVAFAGMALGEFASTNVRTDFLVERLPKKAAKALEFAGTLIIFVALCIVEVLAVQSAITSAVTGEVRIGLAQVPVWPAKLTIAVSMFVFTGVVGARLAFLGLYLARPELGEVPLDDDPEGVEVTALERAL